MRSSLLTALHTHNAQLQLKGLYDGADKDLQMLSRVLDATPSVIERIRTGQSHPTPHFAQRIRTVALYYVEHNYRFSDVRAKFDPAYGFGNAFYDFLWYDYFLAYALCVLVWLLTLWMKPLYRYILTAAFAAFYLVLGLSIWIGAPAPVADPYVHTLHHQLEQRPTLRPAR